MQLNTITLSIFQKINQNSLEGISDSEKYLFNKKMCLKNERKRIRY